MTFHICMTTCIEVRIETAVNEVCCPDAGRTIRLRCCQILPLNPGMRSNIIIIINYVDVLVLSLHNLLYVHPSIP
jgi:hypothetical protein